MNDSLHRLRVTAYALGIVCLVLMCAFALLVAASNGKTAAVSKTAMAIHPIMTASDPEMVAQAKLVKTTEPLDASDVPEADAAPEPEAAPESTDDASYAEDYAYSYDAAYTYYGDGDAFAWDASYGASDFRGLGRVSDGNAVYTWYSENVLSGGGLDDLNANGRHVDDNGYVVDGDGYIALATPGSPDEIGTVIDTPFGPGKVYDTNPGGDSYDVYTSW